MTKHPRARLGGLLPDGYRRESAFRHFFREGQRSMSSHTPIYSADHCTAAYQLNWAVTFFARAPLPDANFWAHPLREVLEESDAIRILECRLPTPDLVQFLVSTRPASAPATVLQRRKGRLQHLLRDGMPKAFRRNYRLESVGSAKRQVIEEYIEKQVHRHSMADARIQSRFEWVQIVSEEVDLSTLRSTAHGSSFTICMSFWNMPRAGALWNRHFCKRPLLE